MLMILPEVCKKQVLYIELSEIPAIPFSHQQPPNSFWKIVTPLILSSLFFCAMHACTHSASVSSPAITSLVAIPSPDENEQLKEAVWKSKQSSVECQPKFGHKTCS